MNDDFVSDSKGWRINRAEGVAVGPTIYYRGYAIALLAEKKDLPHLRIAETVIKFDILGHGVTGANLEEVRDLIMMLLDGVDRPNWESAEEK